jgi:hypothetical protein
MLANTPSLRLDLVPGVRMAEGGGRFVMIMWA